MDEPGAYDREIPLPPPPARLHFVGIGGSGMSGLARMLAEQGYQVTGSDAAESPATASLRGDGIAVTIGHDAANVADADFVIVTAAVKPSNPELVAAAERGIPVAKRAAVLGLLCNQRDCIAVAGTHGKSTTSGMLAVALTEAGERPAFAVGATVRRLGVSTQTGSGPLFVVEADEYDYSFLWLRPSVAVVTTIEYDHPDIFPTPDAVADAFRRFAARIRPGGTLVTSADDPGCRELAASLPAGGPRVVTFGFTPSADWRIERVAGWDHFTGPDSRTLRLRLQVPGAHNRLNAAAALAAASAAGIDPFRLAAGLEAFNGVGRRFDVRGQAAGVTVIDDYAHHPTEIRATIAAARERYPAATIWAVFQPHTYSRTQRLLDDFAAALALADHVILTPIYPARETDTLGVRSEDIAARVGPQATVVRSVEEAGEQAAAATAGDVVLLLGAGDIWKAGETVLRRLHERTGQP